MHEHMARTVYYFGVHLTYASLVCLFAWGLTSTLRASATSKYWIWAAASLNFVLPLGAVVDKSFASHLSWAAPLSAVGPVGIVVADHAAGVGAVWLAGVLLMSARLWVLLRQRRGPEQSGAGDPAPRWILDGIAVRFTAGGGGPAVRGCCVRTYLCRLASTGF